MTAIVNLPFGDVIFDDGKAPDINISEIKNAKDRIVIHSRFFPFNGMLIYNPKDEEFDNEQYSQLAVKYVLDEGFITDGNLPVQTAIIA